jgi:hypothetical protein
LSLARHAGLFVLFLTIVSPLFSQSTIDFSTKGKDAETKTANPITGQIKTFRGYELGMDISVVKKLLAKDALFNYRGEPDVMFTPDRKETIIECAGNSYIERAYFQFNDNRLFILTVVLSQSTLDYYTMFSTLSAKYGQPSSLNPDEAVWETPEVRLSLEKPLSVKYIAIKVFDRLKEAGKAESQAENLARDQFLKEF